MILYNNKFVCDVGAIKEYEDGLWAVRIEVADWERKHGGLILRNRKWVELFRTNDKETANLLQRAIAQMDDWRAYR